jgi:hypothetical protein
MASRQQGYDAEFREGAVRVVIETGEHLTGSRQRGPLALPGQAQRQGGVLLDGQLGQQLVVPHPTLGPTDRPAV